MAKKTTNKEKTTSERLTYLEDVIDSAVALFWWAFKGVIVAFGALLVYIFNKDGAG